MVNVASAKTHNILKSNKMPVRGQTPITAPPTGENYSKLRLDLSTKLQSSLELEVILNTFNESVQSVLPCIGMRYTATDQQSTFDFDEISGHSVSYNVSSQTEPLGELSFFKRMPFAEAELAFLEIMVSVLVLPLRNALTYREAIKTSYTDPLTKIGNRVALEPSSLREVKLAQRYNKPLSLLLVDLDFFKKVNDEYGHIVGDRVLADTATVLSDTLRESDQAFRYGGEEFVIMLSETTMEEAFLTAQRIRKALAAAEFKYDDTELNITASFGVASLTQEDNFTDILERADRALYEAKSNGRDCVQCQRTSGQIKKTA